MSDIEFNLMFDKYNKMLLSHADATETFLTKIWNI